ncbi:flagellar biosynthetic protein FliR [Jeongeupia chitinilytica]|uniref:Flagellar biosynthetic protein FliR n=1 Tax=Jeongeupia chitinilytica TaxID=1041641 RepID=A0ABQ3GWC0_9NEIS|nr:flagellar biosynthetic protein FliR [Jeongeupia chitinilytica]GHD55494.1 flagellar biosynthetic protein FliR [Jeongeupia chitinilytica]
MFTVTQAQIELWLALFWWPFCRFFGLLIADPIFSNKVVSVRVRVGLAIALSVLVAPMLTPPPGIEVVSPAGILIAVNQLLIGVMLGFSVRLMFNAVDMAGQVIGLQMGLGFASFFDPHSAANVPIVAQFINMVLLLVFLALNGHLIVLRILIESFGVLPLDARPLGAGGLRLLVEQGAAIFRLGLMLAMPVVGALLITNLAIGIMTRAAPQLNVFAIGFPLLLAIGIAAMYVSLPYMVPHIDAMLAALTRSAAQMFAALRPG